VSELSPEEVEQIRAKEREGRDYFWLILDTLSREPCGISSLRMKLRLEYNEIQPVLLALRTCEYVEATKTKEVCPACGRKTHGVIYNVAKRGKYFLRRIERT
jgi:hypothetical protein